MVTGRCVDPGAEDVSVSLDQRRLGGLRWIVLRSPDREAFRALGEHVRDEMTTLTEAWPVLPRLRRHVSGSPGNARLAAVRQATAEHFGEGWAELAPQGGTPSSKPGPGPDRCFGTQPWPLHRRRRAI